MSKAVERLVRWISQRLAASGGHKSDALGNEEVSFDLWYVPAMTGCATDEHGFTARQIAFGGQKQQQDPAMAGRIQAVYADVINSPHPLRSALASACNTRSAWDALGAYLVPYESSLPAHTAAVQLAVALQDIAGAAIVAKGATYLARTHEYALGLLDGAVIGARNGSVISSGDLQSLLLSPRSVDAARVSEPVLRMRTMFNNLRAKLAEPELMRDAIGVLGLLTARDWWYDGSRAMRTAVDRDAEQLRSLIENHWGVFERTGEPSGLNVRRRRSVEADLRRELEALAEADEVLRSDLTDFAKLRTIHSLLVPEVWGASAFKSRLTGKNLRSVLLTRELTEQFHSAFAAARMNINHKLKGFQA